VQWITTRMKNGELKRHMEVFDWWGDSHVICDLELIEDKDVLEKDDPTASKCKNCFRVLKRLIQE